MRSAVAVFLPILMVTAMVACALTTCALAADPAHACCHGHNSGIPGAPNAAAHQCIHTLLERGKIVAGFHWAALPRVPGKLSPAKDSAPVPVPERLANSAGLFLKIRVLLI